MAEPRSRTNLLPCPWCGGRDIGLYFTDGIEYAQCRDCTSCGPDHINGRHWNNRHVSDEQQS